MNQFEQAKKKFDNISVSDQLEAQVAQAIENARMAEATKISGRKHSGAAYKWGIGAAACLFLGFTVAVNVNTTFAAGLQDIPVIGGLVRLVTMESYQEKNEDYGITVEVPSLEEIGEKNKGFSKEINLEISEMCNRYVQEAKQRAIEYKEAFLDTGGTPQEWKEHDIQIKVGYEIKSQSDKYLSFVVSGTENWTSAYAQNIYYNLNVETLEYVTLEDLLGTDYIDIVNESIQSEIETRSANGETFFSKEEGGFETIADDQQFYINGVGNPIIVFEKYAIAPGSMGNVEFEIERPQDKV